MLNHVTVELRTGDGVPVRISELKEALEQVRDIAATQGRKVARSITFGNATPEQQQALRDALLNLALTGDDQPFSGKAPDRTHICCDSVQLREMLVAGEAEAEKALVEVFFQVACAKVAQHREPLYQ